MATPIEQEQIRQEELAAAEKQSAQANQKTVDVNLIQGATPDDQKPKGTAKLPSLLFALGSQIPQIIQPSLQNLIQKYLPDPDTCPNETILNELIVQRNNIVQSLNNIGTRIDQLGTSISGVSTFLNTTLGIITATDIASIAISAAAKFVPIIPGAVPAALNDLQTLIRKVTFDGLGNSKLSKLQGVINTQLFKSLGVNHFDPSKFSTTINLVKQNKSLNPAANKVLADVMVAMIKTSDDSLLSKIFQNLKQIEAK